MKTEEKNTLVLDKCQKFCKSTTNSSAYREWFYKALECESFYNGDIWGGRKDPKDLEVNLIEGYVNALIGEQLKTKTSVSVRSREMASEPDNLPTVVGLTQEEIDQTVLAYNAKLFKTYEQCNVLYYQNQSMKDILVYGMAGGFFDVQEGEMIYRRINPLYIIPDLRDETTGFDDSQFVAQMMPMSVNKALKTFPKVKNIVGIEEQRDYIDRYVSPVKAMLTSDHQACDGNIVFVKMVEWKEWERSYSGLAKNGRVFTVFDEEVAEDVAYSKKSIVSSESERIHRAFFAGDTLLHYQALDFTQPREQFSLILACLTKKPSKDGFYVPKSLVENLLDLQKQFAISLAKATYLSHSKKIAINPIALKGYASKMSPEDVKKEVASSTSVLFVDNPKQNLVDFSLENTIKTHVGLSEEFLKLFDQVTGIHREMRGQASNAESGIAIYRRQIQSITSSIYAFNEFDMFKKKVGRLFIQTMQMQAMGKEDIFYPAHPTKPGHVILNHRKGDKIIRDVNFLPLDIYIEESPDFLSSKEEQMDILMSLLSSPVAEIILQSPTLMQKLPIPLDPQIAGEVSLAIQRKMQGGQPMQQQTQTPQIEGVIQWWHEHGQETLHRYSLYMPYRLPHWLCHKNSDPPRA